MAYRRSFNFQKFSEFRALCDKAAANPESVYWMEAQERARAAFAKVVTDAEWDEFVAYYQADQPTTKTWKALFEIWQAAVEAYTPGVSIAYVAQAAGILPETTPV